VFLLVHLLFPAAAGMQFPDESNHSVAADGALGLASYATDLSAPFDDVPDPPASPSSHDPIAPDAATRSHLFNDRAAIAAIAAVVTSDVQAAAAPLTASVDEPAGVVSIAARTAMLCVFRC